VRTSFLYPKHVEVVEDLASMIDVMVDEIVSSIGCCSQEESELVWSNLFPVIRLK